MGIDPQGNENTEEFLKWSYEQCQTGYHSRDQMTSDVFDKMSQIFTLLIALLAVPSLIHIQGIPRIVYLIIVGTFGFISLSALLLHLQSIVSCKTALRWGCKSIEEKIVKNYPGNEISQHWYLIDNRERHGIEKLTYNISRYLSTEDKIENNRFEGEGRIVISSAMMLIVLWVVLVLLTFIYTLTSSASILK